jgi:hypothetical protein
VHSGAESHCRASSNRKRRTKEAGLLPNSCVNRRENYETLYPRNSKCKLSCRAPGPLPADAAGCHPPPGHAPTNMPTISGSFIDL